MHLGNLFAMLLAWLDVRSHHGKMIFRLEDLDPSRSKEEYAQALAEDLRWLGLDWDEGWPDPAFRQSSRTSIYEQSFHVLEEQGLLYPCWCTRSQRHAARAPHQGEAERDDCRCLTLSATERAARFASGRPPAWKIHVPALSVAIEDGHYGFYEQNLAQEGDFILRRSDGVYAYQLAVSVDDMLMGVTRVVRGWDLLSSAPRQAWLIRNLGGEPPCYCHCPLLVQDGGKLSKRLGSLSTQVLRQTRPQTLVGQLAFWAGLLPAPEPVTPEELIPLFSWNRVPTENIPVSHTDIASAF